MLSPVAQEPTNSMMVVGEELLMLNSQPKGQARFALDTLTTHICLLGTTGSGKSTSAKILCLELHRCGIPILILDRTGEYAEGLAEPCKATVLEPGENLSVALFSRREEEELAFQIEDWLSLLDHFYHVSYSAAISPLQGRVLREVLERYYHGTRQTLTVSSLIGELEGYERKVQGLNGWAEGIEAVISRLWPLTVGKVGATFDRSYSTFKTEQLFEPGLVTIIDLSSLPDDRARNLLSQVILKQVYDAVRRRGGKKATGPSLMTLLDEAQHLAPNRHDYIGIPERCAIELRKYGFSLMTCATRPTLISPNIIANSNTLISHMLNNQEDISIVSSFLIGGSSVKETLRKLQVGEALVQVNYPRPKNAMYCRMGTTEQRRAIGVS